MYNPITEYRKAGDRLRGIARNRGTTLATTYARDRAITEQDRAVGVLLRSYGDGHRIVGLLVEEAKLAERDWQHRPELKARILAVRSELRRLEKEPQPDRLGNTIAQEGCDRCFCGCKYWENDRCIDCNTHINEIKKG